MSSSSTTFSMTDRATGAINPWIIAISVMLGTFMEVLDTTVVNVSLQHIAGSLSVTPEEATWVLTSYLVANAIVLPLTGWLANYFGRRNILLVSVARIHGIFVSLRHRAEPAYADHLPYFSGRNRRRTATTLASHPDGSLSAGEARQGHGILGAGHRGCAHARSGARRLDH